MKKIIIAMCLVLVLMASLGFVVAGKNQQQKQDKEFALPDNAVEVAPGVFYLGKALDKGKVVEGYAFVHYAKGSDRAKKAKPNGDDSSRYKLLGIKWPDGATVSYEVNDGGSGLDQGNVKTTLEASLNTWDSAIKITNPGFELFDAITDTNGDYLGNDGMNLVKWANLGSGIIAMNTLWYNTATREIIDSDVQFSTDYTWDTNGVSGAMDLQNIATHEFGHNGLADLYNRPAQPLTMYGYSDFGETSKRDLATGDKLGIQALYGI